MDTKIEKLRKAVIAASARVHYDIAAKLEDAFNDLFPTTPPTPDPHDVADLKRRMRTMNQTLAACGAGIEEHDKRLETTEAALTDVDDLKKRVGSLKGADYGAEKARRALWGAIRELESRFKERLDALEEGKPCEPFSSCKWFPVPQRLWPDYKPPRTPTTIHLSSASKLPCGHNWWYNWGRKRYVCRRCGAMAVVGCGTP